MQRDMQGHTHVLANEPVENVNDEVLELGRLAKRHDDSAHEHRGQRMLRLHLGDGLHRAGNTSYRMRTGLGCAVQRSAAQRSAAQRSAVCARTDAMTVWGKVSGECMAVSMP
jgi:hypothetical protein